MKLVRTDAYPFLWDEAPSSLNDYPLIKNCSSLDQSINGSCRFINPWNYLDRLGLYKILTIQTTPLMPFSSVDNRTNILFGLPSQFSWQYRSNRLFSNKTLNVSTGSWWGSANYYLSVIPFLAAVSAGIIQQEPFILMKAEDFCTTIVECVRQTPAAMAGWINFFSLLSQPTYCPTSEFDDRIIDRCYLGPMWSAHIASIQSALPIIVSKLALLPSTTERRFALAWGNLVDFIGRSRKNTNLIETDKYQDKFLPSRLLRENDHPPHCPDLPYTVNKGLEFFLAAHDDWYPELKRLWQRPTCNFEARREAQQVLETVALSKTEALSYYLEALFNAYHFPCDQ